MASERGVQAPYSRPHLSYPTGMPGLAVEPASSKQPAQRSAIRNTIQPHLRENNIASEPGVQAPHSRPHWSCPTGMPGFAIEPASSKQPAQRSAIRNTIQPHLLTTATAIADFESLRQTIAAETAPTHTSRFRTWLPRFTTFASSISAASGLARTLNALRQDRLAKDSSYQRTMHSILENLAVTSSSFAVGAIIAGTAAAAMSGSVLIPAALGAAAGAGTAYAMDYALQRIRNPGNS